MPNAPTTWDHGYPWWAKALFQAGPIGVLCAVLWYSHSDSSRQRQDALNAVRDEIKSSRDEARVLRQEFALMLKDQRESEAARIKLLADELVKLRLVLLAETYKVEPLPPCRRERP